VSHALACDVAVSLNHKTSHSNIHDNSYSFFLSVTEYVYSFSVNGSVGFFSNLVTLLYTESQNNHCVQTTDQEYIIFTHHVGSAYFHASN
jgi:hypothetical protein